MNKEEVNAQYHILFLKQKHRAEWGVFIENILNKRKIKPEKITTARIFSIYSLFNSDDKTEELDLIEKGKIVAKLFRKNDLIDLHLMKRRKWIELANIPLKTIKFSEK